MQQLENFCIAKKPASILVSLVFLGLATNFLPAELEIISRLGGVVAYFSAGVLAAQHAKIWEKFQRIRRPDDKDERS